MSLFMVLIREEGYHAEPMKQNKVPFAEQASSEVIYSSSANVMAFAERKN